MNAILSKRKIVLYAVLTGYFVLVAGAFQAHAQSAGREINLKLTNVTQGGDATATTAKVGDVISFTMDVKNTSSTDLTNYLMKVNIKDFLKTSKITDLGGGHIEGDYIVFPPILQAAGCNCTNTNTFKMKISSCELSKLLSSYEDASKTVTLACPTATPTPAPTQSTPPTGPSATGGIIGAILAVGGVQLWRMMRGAKV